MPDSASIFSAEIKVIDLALDHIEQSRNLDFIIFSDSISVLESLHNRQTENPLLLDVILKHNELADLNNIVFCWLPSHVGIKGNEKADIAAKSALTLNISDLKIPFTDFKPSINTFLRNKWQMSWNAAVLYKLHSIKSRKENPQKLTQLSSGSHPRHLVGKRTAQKDITIDTTSDSQVNSNFPNKWSPASLTFNNYFYLFYIYI